MSNTTPNQPAPGERGSVADRRGVQLSLPMDDLGESKYEVIRTIPVVIQPEDEEFLASFFEANVHASGGTDQEAFDNLRSMILDTFDTLAELEASELAAPALQQLKVLERYVRRRAE